MKYGGVIRELGRHQDGVRKKKEREINKDTEPE